MTTGLVLSYSTENQMPPSLPPALLGEGRQKRNRSVSALATAS